MDKECMFTQRLTTFHQTMAPAGATDAEHLVLSARWTEAVAGRSGKEMASAILSLLSSPQLLERPSLTVWLDNCGGQNKNYMLFQALLVAVRPKIPFHTPAIHYFVAGHTFMSADSFHAAVKKSMKKERAVLNVRDFEVIA